MTKRAPGSGTISRKGYVRLSAGFTAEGKRKFKMEHVAVWEAANGRIPAGMHLHHENGNKRDNRLENLVLISALDHKREHSPNCEQRDGVWWRFCWKCETWKEATEEHWYFTKNGIHGGGCRPCWIRTVVNRKKARRG